MDERSRTGLILAASGTLFILSGAELIGADLGNVPDWIQAIGTVAAFGGTYAVLRDTQKHRARQELEAQARLVGGYIGRPPDDEHLAQGIVRIRMNIVNASDLPIRDIRGCLVRERDGSLVGRIRPIDVLNPAAVVDGISKVGSVDSALAQNIADDGAMVLVFEFDDDAGERWRKYQPGKPHLQLAKEHPLGWEADGPPIIELEWSG